MNSSRAYLDWNATAPLRPAARDAVIAAMEVVGNPSSVHAEGRAARGIVERARGQVASLVGCKPSEVVFTSGATEGASVLHHLPPVSAVCVQDTAHDCLWAHFDLTGANGSPQDPGHTLAMGLANAETGVITEPPKPVEGSWAYGKVRCHALFLDITQAVGRIHNATPGEPGQGGQHPTDGRHS